MRTFTILATIGLIVATSAPAEAQKGKGKGKGPDPKKIPAKGMPDADGKLPPVVVVPDPPVTQKQLEEWSKKFATKEDLAKLDQAFKAYVKADVAWKTKAESEIKDVKEIALRTEAKVDAQGTTLTGMSAELKTVKDIAERALATSQAAEAKSDKALSDSRAATARAERAEAASEKSASDAVAARIAGERRPTAYPVCVGYPVPYGVPYPVADPYPVPVSVSFPAYIAPAWSWWYGYSRTTYVNPTYVAPRVVYPAYGPWYRRWW